MTKFIGIGEDDSIIRQFVNDGKNYSELPAHKETSFENEKGVVTPEPSVSNTQQRASNINGNSNFCIGKGSCDLRSILGLIFGCVLILLAIITLIGTIDMYNWMEGMGDIIMCTVHMIMFSIFLVGGFLCIKK